MCVVMLDLVHRDVFALSPLASESRAAVIGMAVDHERNRIVPVELPIKPEGLLPGVAGACVFQVPQVL